MTTAKGSFEIEMTAQPPLDVGGGVGIGHFRIDKRFAGQLEGTSVVQMLAHQAPVEGSAGYVALERFAGRLDGRAGSFVLQHSGTMGHGQESLQLTVIPDSGTDGLRGLSGRMQILRENDAHQYVFEYQLEA